MAGARPREAARCVVTADKALVRHAGDRYRLLEGKLGLATRAELAAAATRRRLEQETEPRARWRSGRARRAAPPPRLTGIATAENTRR